MHSVSPYIRKTSAFGNISPRGSWKLGGSAAAVFVTRSTVSWRSGERSCIATSVAYIVGTPGKTVTDSSSSRLSVFAGYANERSSTSVAPM